LLKKKKERVKFKYYYEYIFILRRGDKKCQEEETFGDQDSGKQDILVMDIHLRVEEIPIRSVGTFHGYQEVGGQECMDQYLHGLPLLLQDMECPMELHTPMDMQDIPIQDIELIRR
jgi:hypothetical protein